MKLPKLLKIGIYVLLGIGVIVGLFFLFVWLIASGISSVGEGLGF